MNDSRIYPVLLAVVCLGVVSCLTAGCILTRNVIERPEIKVERVEFSGLHLQVEVRGIGLPRVTDAIVRGRMRLVAHNSNTFALPIEAIEYEMFVADHPVVAGEMTTAAGSLPARETTPVTGEMEIRLSAAARAFGEALEPGDVPYRLKMKVRLSTPAGTYRIPLETSGTIPKKIRGPGGVADRLGYSLPGGIPLPSLP